LGFALGLSLFCRFSPLSSLMTYSVFQGFEP
jgi:hypothetical protein